MTDRARILVVDDDSDVRYMLTKYLSRHDFTVDTVEDGIQMRACMDENEFDLVVLDLSLPAEDGLSLARHLRENSAPTIEG